MKSLLAKDCSSASSLPSSSVSASLLVNPAPAPTIHGSYVPQMAQNITMNWKTPSARHTPPPSSQPPAQYPHSSPSSSDNLRSSSPLAQLYRTPSVVSEALRPLKRPFGPIILRAPSTSRQQFSRVSSTPRRFQSSKRVVSSLSNTFLAPGVSDNTRNTPQLVPEVARPSYSGNGDNRVNMIASDILSRKLDQDDGNSLRDEMDGHMEPGGHVRKKFKVRHIFVWMLRNKLNL